MHEYEDVREILEDTEIDIPPDAVAVVVYYILGRGRKIKVLRPGEVFQANADDPTSTHVFALNGPK